jgi:hypothetical protein
MYERQWAAAGIGESSTRTGELRKISFFLRTLRKISCCHYLCIKGIGECGIERREKNCPHEREGERYSLVVFLYARED